MVFPITQSLMIVLFLSGMVAMIMMRTLHRDFNRYNAAEVSDDVEEETGWKLVHGDVFRPPKVGMALSVLVGTGVQLIAMAVITMSEPSSKPSSGRRYQFQQQDRASSYTQRPTCGHPCGSQEWVGTSAPSNCC